jgi:hypothetical protein
MIELYVPTTTGSGPPAPGFKFDENTGTWVEIDAWVSNIDEDVSEWR